MVCASGSAAVGGRSYLDLADGEAARAARAAARAGRGKAEGRKGPDHTPGPGPLEYQATAVSHLDLIRVNVCHATWRSVVESAKRR